MGASRGPPVVTVQATRTLDQHIDWREVADHCVEVEIQRLLHHLGRNQHPVAPAGILLAESREGIVLPIDPVAERKASVK